MKNEENYEESKFNEEVGDILPIETTDSWIENYKKGSEYDEYHSCFYGGKLFLKILSLPGCVGIRLHNAVDKENKQFHVLLTGVDKEGKDIYIPADFETKEDEKKPAGSQTTRAFKISSGTGGNGTSGSGEGGMPCPGVGCPPKQ